MAAKSYERAYGERKMTPGRLSGGRDRWSPGRSDRRAAGYRRNAFADPLLARKGYLAHQWPLPLSGTTPEKVRLSPLGRKIGHWYGVLQTMQDRADRDSALQGVTYLKELLLSVPNDRLTARLIRVIDQCHAGDDRLQQGTFAVIGQLAELGLSLEQWSGLYLMVADTDLLQTFVEESLDILHGESAAAGVQETFALFLAIWKTERIPGIALEDFEKRRYFRKRIQIPGHFNPLHSDERSEIIIRDICPGGIGFRAIGRNVPEENDLIRVFFLLDGYMNKYINKLALVRRFDGVYAGAQFF